MQTATLPATGTQNGRMLDGKEQRECLRLIAFHKGEFITAATVRVWTARTKNPGASYCSVWVNTYRSPKGNHGAGGYAGHGQANGWGYHRPSAAMQAALDSAGIKLATPIDGVGEGAMRDALLAIGRALGFRVDRLHVVEA